jgi:hypothetical protein
LHSHVSHQPNRETKPKHITKSKVKEKEEVLQLNAPGSAFTFKEEEERMSCKKN